MNEWIVKRNDKMRTNTILVLYWRLTMISFTVFPNSLSRSLSCFLFLFEIFRRSILIFSSCTHIVLRKNDGSSFAMPHFALAMAVKKSWIIQVFSPLCFFFLSSKWAYFLSFIQWNISNFFYSTFFWLFNRDQQKTCRKTKIKKIRRAKIQKRMKTSEIKMCEKNVQVLKGISLFSLFLRLFHSSILSVVACGKKGTQKARICACLCMCEHLYDTSYICPKWQTIKMRIIALSHNKRCVNLKVIIYRYEFTSLLLDFFFLRTQILALSFPFFCFFISVCVYVYLTAHAHAHTHILTSIHFIFI